VVGYSALVEADEDATLAALRATEADVIEPQVALHNGRIFKRMGDGYLVEFASVVQAVDCALKWQASSESLRFRIGIHLGDVVIDGADLHGAGVNIAVRIEGLAEPGGICLSREARDQVRDRLKVALEDLGHIEVKNIDRPVRVFRVTDRAASPKKVDRKPAYVPMVAVAAIIIGVSVALWLWQPWVERVEAADPENMALAMPDRPSIAVLPFDNLTEGGEQAYFAMGITEDIVTDLSKISGLFVIARESSFRLTNESVEVRHVAEQLGVRYVLQGSVRRSDNTIRVTARLIDALSGRLIWAERYDREPKEIIVVQSDVAREVARAMAVTLTANENERLYQKYIANIEAYETFLQARRTVDLPTRDNVEAGEELFRRVIELDPNFAGGYAGLAFNLGVQVRFQYSDDPARDLQASFENASTAVELDPQFAWGYIALGGAHLAKGEQDAAVDSIRDALRLEPNGYEANLFAGFYLQFAGKHEEAIEHLLLARRLSPVPSVRDLAFLSLARFMNGEYQEHVRLTRELHEKFPKFRGTLSMTFLAASLTLLDRPQEAAEAVRLLRENHPDFSLSEWRFLKSWKRAEDRAHLYDAAKNAGVPEFPATK
jgi:TolB-like protein